MQSSKMVHLSWSTLSAVQTHHWSFGMNLAQYVAIPKKLHTPVAVVGAKASLIASTFLGSGAIPSPEKTNPKIVTEHLLNSHFFSFSVRLTFKSHLQTASRATSCSACVFPKTMISLLMLRAQGLPQSWSWMVFWKISLAEFVTKFNQVYLQSPFCVAKVVMYRLSEASDSWWYPDRRSSLENTVAPLRVWIKLSTVGIRCFSRLMAWFAILMSTQIWTPPCFFGVMTSGDTQGVRPSNLSMIPFLSRLCNSASTFWRTWKGILRGCWVTGVTVSSMCSFTSTSLSWPMPLQSVGYFLNS